MKAEKRAERVPVTHERFGRGLAGLTVMATVLLGYAHSPYWLLAALGVAMNLALSALTDRCAVKNLLIRLGLPGERDLGRAEALGVEPTASNALLSKLPSIGDEPERGSVQSRHPAPCAFGKLA